MTESERTDEWFFVDAARQQQGPTTAADLLARHARGELRPDALVWCAGMAEWQPLRQVMALPETPAPVPEVPVVRPVPTVDPLPSQASIMPPGALIDRSDIVYAGFWRRVAAYQLDGILLSIASYAITLPMAMMMGMSFSHLEATADSGPAIYAMWPMIALTYLLVFALQAAYFAWMHARPAQATLGKMAVGIKVVGPDGGRIGFGRGLGRWLALFLSALPFGIGFLMAAFTERKRALHDMICDTQVVDRWAYTDQPQLQKRGLDGVTIAVLVIMALMWLFIIGMLLLLAAVIGSGSWH